MSASFADDLAAWAAGQSTVTALVLIGSHVRAVGAVNAADAASDWDFQLVTTTPARWASGDWVPAIGRGPALAYSCRPTFGGVNKVTFLLAGGVEVDLVVLAAGPLRAARVAVALGLHRRPGRLRQALADLAIVIRPGHRFLKGENSFGRLYARVVAEVDDPRTGNNDLVRLADGFVCDLVWARRKLARGEYLAAQRMLHQGLAETNFRLLHEARLRRGGASYPEARRIERVATAEELGRVTVVARPEQEDLGRAVEASWATLRELMAELVPGWRPPVLD